MAIAGLGSGFGATLSDGTNSYATVISFSISGATVGVTDISNAGSVNDCGDYLPNVIDAGNITFVLRMGGALGTTADANMTTLHAFFLARTISTWTLTIPGDATVAVSGFISRLGVGLHYKGGVQTQVTVKCTGLPAYTAAS